MSADLTVSGHGTIYLLRPRTKEGRVWIDENVAVEQTFGSAVAIGHRYINEIVEAAVTDGLDVEVR